MMVCSFKQSAAQMQKFFMKREAEHLGIRQPCHGIGGAAFLFRVKNKNEQIAR